MIRLSDFGITPDAVTTLCVESVIEICLCAAAAILLTCLFGIGLYRKAEARGEKKPFYAFLPLLRYYTLGRMAPGSEKTKKIFACLLPSLAIAMFLSAVITGALLFKTFMAMIFVAEESAGAVKLSALLEFPVNYCLIGVIITSILSAAIRIIEAVCLFGAFEEAGKRRIVFTLLSYFIPPLACVFLYSTTRPRKQKAEVPADKAE